MFVMFLMACDVVYMIGIPNLVSFSLSALLCVLVRRGIGLWAIEISGLFFLGLFDECILRAYTHTHTHTHTHIYIYSCLFFSAILFLFLSFYLSQSVWLSIVIYSHMQIHIYIYTQHHNDTINKQTQEDFFISICTSHFICEGSKRVTQGFMVRGSWRSNRNCHILTPLLWPSALCLSRSPDAQPEALGPTLLCDGFLYCILSASSRDPNSIWGPEPLRSGVAFLTISRL